MTDDERYLLKPMNCPHHIMIYKSKPRSYRDLPVRLAEFGTVYRFEQSGELAGMTRVRGFTQDDAHIFCTEEQVADEFRGCLDMTQTVLALARAERLPRAARLPRSDERQVRRQRRELGTGPRRRSSRSCREMNLPGCTPEPGEAAFYGPKVDFVVTDCIGREWQLGTVQLDYNLPSKERFALEYIGADNHPHRPVMIHRAPLGSMERFVGVLIEHFAGAFPLWLAPEQVRVLTVSEKVGGLRPRGRGEAARRRLPRDGRLPGREAQRQDSRRPARTDPLHVRGRREGRDGRTVAVRDRIEGDLGADAARGGDRQTLGRGPLEAGPAGCQAADGAGRPRRGE